MVLVSSAINALTTSGFGFDRALGLLVLIACRCNRPESAVRGVAGAVAVLVAPNFSAIAPARAASELPPGPRDSPRAMCAAIAHGAGYPTRQTTFAPFRAVPESHA